MEEKDEVIDANVVILDKRHLIKKEDPRDIPDPTAFISGVHERIRSSDIVLFKKTSTQEMQVVKTRWVLTGKVTEGYTYIS